MIKKTITILMLSLLPLIAQEDFLKGVKAENLMLDRVEAAPTEIVEEIENKGLGYWDGPILTVIYSPDSMVIAEERFEKPGGRVSGLWIIDTKTNIENKIIDGIVEDLKWSPSGKYLSFIKMDYVSQNSINDNCRKPVFNCEHLCIYNTETKKIDIIVSIIGRSLQHCWSSAGDYLAYSYVSNNTDRYLFEVFDAQRNKSYVIDELILCGLWNFSWSPDGEMIAYTKPLEIDRNVDEEVPLEAEVYVVNRDGSGKTQITDTPEIELFIKWLSDGRHIITEIIRRPGEGIAPEYFKLILKKREKK